LGDHLDDGTVMKEEFPYIPFYQVPGNCDRHYNVLCLPETLVEKVGGVRLFMTHGHLHGVKMGLGKLIKDGYVTNSQAVLFGHTHHAYCRQDEDGLWVINPGSCGYYGGTAAVLEIADGKISGCRIIEQPDLKDFA
jgi:putative phosphoesterase